MPRQSRMKSCSCIYHVMLRGINHQTIFLDEQDFRQFLDVLCHCRKISGFLLFAYCLMDNHIHLLLQTGKEPLDLVMKRIGTRYVHWYNKKYDRCGHLFQDRYKSEPVESASSFFTVLRYILYNPVKAGLCVNPEDYQMSSARDYLSSPGISDTDFAIDIAGKENLLDYLKSSCSDNCMDITPRPLNDKKATAMMCSIVNNENPHHCINIIADNKDKYIPLLRKSGLSIRQITRITGIPFGIVRKY